MITDSMESIFIGRDPKCDIPLRLTGESGISSRHIEIQYNELANFFHLKKQRHFFFFEDLTYGVKN